jgi:transcriptional regulator with XRE-family HTH domain
MGDRRIGLARARKAAGYTQETLAYALDVDPATVNRWERGATEPLVYKRPKLAKLLCVTREPSRSD